MCEGYYRKALMGGSVVSEPFKVICALHETHTPGHRQRVGLKGARRLFRSENTTVVCELLQSFCFCIRPESYSGCLMVQLAIRVSVDAFNSMLGSKNTS